MYDSRQNLLTSKIFPSVFTSCGSLLATCTFEDSSLCGYTHEETSAVEFKWARGSGQTTSFGTGPGFDHTTGSSSGKYIY